MGGLSKKWVTRVQCLIALALVAFIVYMALSLLVSPRMHTIVSDGDMSKLQRILRSFPDLVNARDEQGHTPLHLAAIQDHAAIVDYLILKGADVDARCWHAGKTPLHDAVRWSGLPVLRALLAAGADPNVHNDLADTPLHRATGRRLLLTDHRPEDEMLAKCEMLLLAGADPNALGCRGRTALHNAAEWNLSRVAELLLEHNAQPNARDAEGATPLDWAEAMGGSETAEVLRRHGGRLRVRAAAALDSARDQTESQQ